MAQNYSGNAVLTSITGGISNSDTAFTLASSTGWPSAPFVATLARDTVREEQVYVGARSGTSCTSVTRGYGGTTALSHGAGEPIQHTADAVSMQRWEDHLDDTAGAHAGTAISHTPSGTISATTVSAAINELDSEKAIVTEPIAAAHIVDTAAAHAASAVSVDSSSLTGVGTDVQAVLIELDDAVTAGGGDISVHLSDPSAAHAASAISFTPAGTIAGVNVQTAVAEVATDAASALTAAFTARSVISGDGLTGGGTLAADRTLAVGAGTGIVVAADSVSIDPALIDLDAYSTWVPTLYGTSAALGNSTYVARYQRVGRSIIGQFTLVWGTTGVMASDSLAVSLPVVAFDPGGFQTVIGMGLASDTGVNNYNMIVLIDFTVDTANDRMRFISQGAQLSTNLPFTWTNSDKIVVHFHYEAAS